MSIATLWKRYFDELPLTDRVTHYREIQVGLLMGVFNGFGLSLVSIIARRIGTSSTQIAVMLSMPFVGSLFSLYFGHMTVRREKMPFVFWPGVTSRLLLAVVAILHSPMAFLIIMSLFYFISTIPGPAYASIMSTNYSDGFRARLMGNMRVLQTTVAAAGAFIAGQILEARPDAYRWILPLSACFGIAAAFAFRQLKIKRERTAPSSPVSFYQAAKSIRDDRAFLVFMIIYFCCAMPAKLAIPLEPIWLVDHLRMDYRQAGLILGTVLSMCSVLGYRLWGKLATLVDPLYLVVTIFVLGIMRFPVLALATHPYHVIAASVTAGLSFAGFELIPLFAIMRFAPQGKLPLYIAFHATLMGIRGIIGPFAGSFLYTHLGLQIDTVFWIITGSAGLGILSMLVFAVTWKRQHPTTRNAHPKC